MLKRTPERTWQAAIRAMQQLDLSEDLPNLRMRVLVVAGELDHSLDLAPSGIGLRKIAELVPDGELVVLDPARPRVDRARPRVQPVRKPLPKEARVEDRQVGGRDRVREEHRQRRHELDSVPAIEEHVGDARAAASSVAVEDDDALAASP